MSKIESVSVCVARVPLDRVTSFATRTVSARDYCLVKVRSTEGLEGIGFCYVGSAGGRIAQIAVEEILAPKLIGQNPLRVEGLWQEMYSESLLQGRAGSVMRALSILDAAIWDLNARSAKLPLYQFLGSVADNSFAFGQRAALDAALVPNVSCIHRSASRYPRRFRGTTVSLSRMFRLKPRHHACGMRNRRTPQ